MKVLIGVDPHKASVAVAAVNEAGELVEGAHFSQNPAGLRALERWSKRFPERRWAVENAGGLGRHLAQRLSAAGESVVDVPPKLSARVRVLSTGNSRKNDGLDALATALAAAVQVLEGRQARPLESQAPLREDDEDREGRARLLLAGPAVAHGGQHGLHTRLGLFGRFESRLIVGTRSL